MKIAIVGSCGYIAGFLIDRFAKDKSIEHILKIDQAEQADAYLNLLQPSDFDYGLLTDIDYVIFTAAVSGPDKCAEEFELCWNINVTGTMFFINNAIKKNCRVLFFSSDAVFGENPGQIYDETSDTNAETAYGRMKKQIEDTFMKSPYFKAIRLSYVVSARDRFVSYCLNCIRKNEVADIFHPFYRNCISVSDVVNVVEWFIQNWDDYEPAVLNVAGKELVSRVRIADEINRCFENRLKYMISHPDGQFYQNRPSITQMISRYMRDYKILEDKTFTEKIQIELEEVKL